VHYARHTDQRRFASLESLARRLADGDDMNESVRAAYAMDLESLDAEVQAYVRKQIYNYVEVSSADSVIMRVDSDVNTWARQTSIPGWPICWPTCNAVRKRSRCWNGH
jgi:hypothetical protein